MNSILRQINQNDDKKPNQELMGTYLNLIDEELNKLYAKTDCVDKYKQYFQKFRHNSRQFYQCLQNPCQFSTNKSSLIVRHIRRHLNQKPYLCPIDGCKQQFYQRCDLRCHLMRHFEDKPFKCNFANCCKTYTTRKALSLHIKTHSPFGFNCKECHKPFATKWMVNKHSRERHTLSEQSVSQTSIEDNSQPIIKIESNVSAKVDAMDKPIVKSLTNQLINSVDSINEQIRQDLLSKERIKSFSAEFGFEEVIKYVIHNCGQPSNRQTIVENPIERTANKVVDKCLISHSNPDSNLMANQLLLKCVENVCSLIETYTFESIDANKKVLFKCINCIFTSDAIQPIVGHVFEHISEGVTQFLSNKID